MIGGRAFVDAAVTRAQLTNQQQALAGDPRPGRKGGSAHTAPLELDWMRAVGEALQPEGVARSSRHLVRYGGGVGRG